jgi:hypothetical protein
MAALPGRSQAEPFDCPAQDTDAVVELIQGHKLASAMGDANVTGAKDDRCGAEGNHAGRFGAEGDTA